LKKILTVLLVLVVSGAAGAYWLWNDYNAFLSASLPVEEKSLFEVKKGSSFNRVVADFKEVYGEVNDHYFKIYGRQSGLANKIKAGEYELKAGLTPVEFLKIITSGVSKNYRFTIIEGSNFKEMMRAISEHKYLKDDVSHLDRNELLKQLGASEKHPEGLFLAETFSIEKNGSALAVLKRSNAMMKKILEDEWQKRDTKLPYKSSYEALIMASIVEKETARADERPIISGVFVRRLNKRMRLQTDPTVIYGMGDEYKGNIRRKDLRKPTPYNTYVIPALPPTPIAMVGREAIVAALNPADGKALYFVAKGDGSHYFSATLKEHNNAVRRYQLTRRKDYRSSP